MNIFDNIKKYATSWEPVETREFNEEEIAAVKEAVVVTSKFGNSVKFTYTTGGCGFIPVDRDSSLAVGEIVDLTKAKLVVLAKDGETINRVL